jgi:zinc transport system permease protein
VFEFFGALGEFTFLQNALIAGLLASVASGIIGTYVVARRITYIAGGIAHSILAGMGAAYFLGIYFQWGASMTLPGAIITALLAAIIIGLVSLRAGQREDSIIGAVWAVGMAVGIIFIARTPGYNQDLMSYLFGNLLMIGSSELWLIGILDITVVGLAFLFHNQFTAVCFDEEFARVRGLNVEMYYILLLALTALTVVILVTVVGIVMVIALLTLPAAIGTFFTGMIKKLMLISIMLSILFVSCGLYLSYTLDLPSGATIILLAGSAYLFAALITGLVRKS